VTLNRKNMKAGCLSRYLLILLPILILSCASHVRRDINAPLVDITESRLYQIHQEVRFTRFYYADGKMESGLMLNWMPDSITIQERGKDFPSRIPTQGLIRIETVTGNRLFAGMGLGVLGAAAYFAAVQGWKLSSVSFLEGAAKLLVPSAIIIVGIGYGASRETKEIYRVPPGFKFDYVAAKMKYQKVKD
jgi:hypothetical protein